MVNAYWPEPGDIISMDFSPQTGHEQKGLRPGVVVSNSTFNRFTRLAIVCPITNTRRDMPLHIGLDERTTTGGVIMAEQVKSLDISKRSAIYLERLPSDLLDELLDIISGFIETESDR